MIYNGIKMLINVNTNNGLLEMLIKGGGESRALHSRGDLNSPSSRFDEGASAEAKLALIMPSEEEKEAQPPTGARRAG